jgi:hypothetical protein
MKRILIIAAALLMVCACAKDVPGQYRGDYTFKTGGSIDLAGVVSDCLGFVKKDTVMTRRLVPESGQMHILAGDQAGTLKVTMNILGGDPVVFDAQVDGTTLLLLPVRRIVPLRQLNEDLGIGYDLTVYGSGVRYENMVVFQLEYTGDISFDGFEGKVLRSRANCIATRNE